MSRKIKYFAPNKLFSLSSLVGLTKVPSLLTRDMSSDMVSRSQWEQTPKVQTDVGSCFNPKDSCTQTHCSIDIVRDDDRKTCITIINKDAIMIASLRHDTGYDFVLALSATHENTLYLVTGVVEALK